MVSNVLCDAYDDVNVACIWSRLIVLSIIVTGILYTIGGLIVCRNLIRKDFRWLLMLILYFVVGGLHALLTLSILCIAIACVFYTFGEHVKGVEIVTYAAVMVVVTMYFALGRKAILYAIEKKTSK